MAVGRGRRWVAGIFAAGLTPGLFVLAAAEIYSRANASSGSGRSIGATSAFILSLGVPVAVILAYSITRIRRPTQPVATR